MRKPLKTKKQWDDWYVDTGDLSEMMRLGKTMESLALQFRMGAYTFDGCIGNFGEALL